MLSEKSKNFDKKSDLNQSEPNQRELNQSKPKQSKPNQSNRNFLKSPRAPWSYFLWCSSTHTHSDAKQGERVYVELRHNDFGWGHSILCSNSKGTIAVGGFMMRCFISHQCTNVHAAWVTCNETAIKMVNQSRNMQQATNGCSGHVNGLDNTNQSFAETPNPPNPRQHEKFPFVHTHNPGSGEAVTGQTVVDQAKRPASRGQSRTMYVVCCSFVHEFSSQTHHINWRGQIHHELFCRLETVTVWTDLLRHVLFLHE